MVDVVIQGVWVLYRIDKDKGDESLPLLAFQKQCCQYNYSEMLTFDCESIDSKIHELVLLNLSCEFAKKIQIFW